MAKNKWIEFLDKYQEMRISQKLYFKSKGNKVILAEARLREIECDKLCKELTSIAVEKGLKS